MNDEDDDDDCGESPNAAAGGCAAVANPSQCEIELLLDRAVMPPNSCEFKRLLF